MCMVLTRSVTCNNNVCVCVRAFAIKFLGVLIIQIVNY